MSGGKCIFTFKNNDWSVENQCINDRDCPTFSPGVGLMVKFEDGSIQFHEDGAITFSSAALVTTHPAKTDDSGNTTVEVQCSAVTGFQQLPAVVPAADPADD